MRLTGEQVLGLMGQGRLGFRSRVRRPGEANWGPTSARPEFAFALPHMNFLGWKKSDKYVEAEGLAMVSPSVHRTVDFARKLGSDPASGKYAFWFSAHVDWASGPVVRKAQLFKMWDGFWLAPIVESSTVRPGTWLNIYLIAFNFTGKTQVRSIHAPNAPISEESRPGLDFTVPPGRWTAQRVSIAATQPPGEHRVELKTRTGAQRAATAVAVGVLTLGSFVHVPGSMGFSLGYRILPPDVAKTVAEWEAWGVQAAQQRFDTAGAVAIADAAGNRTPRETILQWFRAYLTPSLILAALQDRERGAQAVISSYFDDFIFVACGADAAEKAFVPGTGA